MNDFERNYLDGMTASQWVSRAIMMNQSPPHPHPAEPCLNKRSQPIDGRNQKECFPSLETIPVDAPHNIHKGQTPTAHKIQPPGSPTARKTTTSKARNRMATAYSVQTVVSRPTANQTLTLRTLAEDQAASSAANFPTAYNFHSSVK